MASRFETVAKQIAEGKIAPVYLLYGAEPYFIDKVTEMLDSPGVVLQPGEESFNRSLLYGADTKVGQILNEAQSFPVMAQRRLVVVREAQGMHKYKEAIKGLLPYLKSPAPSTVLVIAIKDDHPGLTPSQIKELPKSVVIMQSRRMYDRDMQNWVTSYLTREGLQYDPAIPRILVDSLGTDPGFVQQEVDKMLLYLKATGQQQLTKDYVFEMINVDKNFNSFELVKALATRNSLKAHLIVDRLSRNTKTNPPVLTIGALSRFFTGLGLVHQLALKDPNSIKNRLKVNYFQAKDLVEGAKNYDPNRTQHCLRLIREADAKIKGAFFTVTDTPHALKTLVLKILS